MDREKEKNTKGFFDCIEVEFDKEAQLYRQKGIYSSYLGDAMLLGLANFLHVEIIVFTSIESWPQVTIHPRLLPLTQRPIYLGHIHTGSGQ